MLATMFAALIAFALYLPNAYACDDCKVTQASAFSGSKMKCKGKVTCKLTGVMPETWEAGCETGTSCLLSYDFLPQHDHCKVKQGVGDVCDEKGGNPVTHTTKTSDGCGQFLFVTWCHSVDTDETEHDHASGTDCPD